MPFPTSSSISPSVIYKRIGHNFLRIKNKHGRLQWAEAVLIYFITLSSMFVRISRNSQILNILSDLFYDQNLFARQKYLTFSVICLHDILYGRMIFPGDRPEIISCLCDIAHQPRRVGPTPRAPAFS